VLLLWTIEYGSQRDKVGGGEEKEEEEDRIGIKSKKPISMIKLTTCVKKNNNSKNKKVI
jgi:hypothetical protein